MEKLVEKRKDLDLNIGWLLKEDGLGRKKMWLYKCSWNRIKERVCLCMCCKRVNINFK